MPEDGISLHATEWTVSASEKVSTGEYQSADAHTTVKGKIPVHAGELDDETRTELKAKLLALHNHVQETVERAAENRIAADGHEDWSVQNGGSGDA